MTELSDHALRRLNERESKILKLLLAKDFPGRAEVQAQLTNALVKPLDADGSVGFRVDETLAPAPVVSTVPVDADGQDIDGIPVYILLHVYQGFVQELEIYKADSTEIKVFPEDWRVRIRKPT